MPPLSFTTSGFGPHGCAQLMWNHNDWFAVTYLFEDGRIFGSAVFLGKGIAMHIDTRGF